MLKYQLAFDRLTPRNDSQANKKKTEREPIQEILGEMYAAMIAAKYFQPGSVRSSLGCMTVKFLTKQQRDECREKVR